MRSFSRNTAVFAVFLYVGIGFFNIGLKTQPSFAQPKDKVEEQEKELQNIQEQIKEKKKKIREVKEKEAAALQKLVVVKKELQETKGQLNQTWGQLRFSKQRLGQLRVELSNTETKLHNKKELLQRRLSEVYKSGGVNYLELIFGARSLADFINKAYYFERVLSYDFNLIKDIISYHQQVTSKKTEQEVRTNEISNLAQVIQQKATEIKGVVNERNQLYGSLKERRRQYEEQLKKLEETSYEIEAMIQRYMAEQGRRGVVGPLGTGKFIWPAHGPLTSYFGYRWHPIWGGRDFHTGLDIGTAYGERIVAADSGMVIFAGWWDGYGKAVIIDHGRGTTTVYAHMSRIYVKKDQKIVKGNTVGLVGSTGYSTGPHLHFEVRRNGTPVNPIKWLP